MKRSEQGQEVGQRGEGGGGDTEEIKVCLQQVRMGEAEGDSDQLHADLQRRPRKNVCLKRESEKETQKQKISKEEVIFSQIHLREKGERRMAEKKRQQPVSHANTARRNTSRVILFLVS